ncbi:hypothetical protein AMTRI_Chr13g121150 [Amborella trichopoda]
MSAKIVALYGDSFDRETLKNKHKLIMKMYSELKKLIGSTGFGWDPLRGMVTVENELWDQYINDYPWAGKFRGKSAHDVNVLDKMFGDTVADGRYSETLVDDGTDNSAPPFEVDDSPIESPHLDTSDEDSDISTPSNARRTSSMQYKRPHPNTPFEVSEKKRQGTPTKQVAQNLTKLVEIMTSLQATIQHEIKMKKCVDDVDELYKKGEAGLEAILKANCIFQNASKVHMFLALSHEYQGAFLEKDMRPLAN